LACIYPSSGSVIGAFAHWVGIIRTLRIAKAKNNLFSALMELSSVFIFLIPYICSLFLKKAIFLLTVIQKVMHATCIPLGFFL
jgi:hypothetical protein